MPNNPTIDTRTFPIKRLIDEAPAFFNLSQSAAAGGLYGESGSMQVNTAYALIVAWLGSSPGTGGGGGGSRGTLVGATVAALNAQTPVDGDLGIIRIGVWPNVHEEFLKWNASAAKWIGEPVDLISQNDTWSMDLGNKNTAQLADWAFFNNPNPFSRPAKTVLTGAQDMSAVGTITVPSTTDFTPTGRLLIRDNAMDYTGKTGTTFTGVTKAFGTGGSCPSGTDVVQGFVGGYGTISETLCFATELQAAGLTLQDQMFALMNGAPDGAHALTIGAYWYQYNNGEGYISIAQPPVGGVGFGNTLTGTVNGGGSKPGERSFFWSERAWAAIALSFTKRYAYPRLFGKMAAGAVDTGQVLDATYRTRWVG